MDKKKSIQELRQLARKLLLLALRLSAVVIVFFVLYLGYYLWQELGESQREKPKKDLSGPDFRGIGSFDINDTVTHHQEAVRWVNLFLDDIIITSEHPHQLEVENTTATDVETSVAPDDAPSREGHAMSAEQGDTRPVHRRRAHRSNDDSDSIDDARRKISFRATLQGLKRVGGMVRFPIGSRWSLETGLTYGHLKTEQNSNSCLAIPLKGVYHFSSIGPVNLYAHGGTVFEKICKGGTSLQLMLNAGVGAEYPFHKKWGVFIEPSLRYHIGNDNNIPQLYGRRLGLNIHLGVTFTP